MNGRLLVTLALTLAGLGGVLGGVVIYLETGALRPSGGLVVFGGLLAVASWIRHLAGA